MWNTNMRAIPLAVVLLLWLVVAAAQGRKGADGGETGGEGEKHRKNVFLLREMRHVVKTDAGEMKVVRSHGGGMHADRSLFIGFIAMEPHSMFIPQYLDSTLILFIHRGEAKIGCIRGNEMVETNLRAGDLYRIPAGSVFYLLNTNNEQRLRIICSIDPSESLGFSSGFKSFFVGGGIDPVSILEGFDQRTLSAAFNVSIGELREVMSRQRKGPIVYTDRHPSMWSEFLKLKQQDRLDHMKRISGEGEGREERKPAWSWRRILRPFATETNRMSKNTAESTEPFNIYDKEPDFKNDYGWSTAVDQLDYTTLQESGVGMYLVNLTAGSMMVPHLNPTATEYGIILSGSGALQVVFPDGTGTNAMIGQGDVFWVPKYFPFCQIASRDSSLEFIGFTTSSHRNRPRFLIGADSLLNQMRGPEMAAAFGVSEERLRHIVTAQREAVIVPSNYAAPGDGVRRAAAAK